MCGVYPNADVMSAGEQISSTYEGRYVTLTEEELKHPTQTYGWVTKGDPVIFCLAGTETSFGIGVGVAMTGNSQLDDPATSDLIAVDTEGIWIQNVLGTDDDGDSDVVPGDALYISTAVPGCIISKIANPTTNIPFGYALGFVTGGADGDIAVKVHSYREIPDYLELAGGKITIASWGITLAEAYHMYLNDDYSCYIGSSANNVLIIGTASGSVEFRCGAHGAAFTIDNDMLSTPYLIRVTGIIDFGAGNSGAIRLPFKTSPVTQPTEGQFWYNETLEKLEFATGSGTMETVTSA